MESSKVYEVRTRGGDSFTVVAQDAKSASEKAQHRMSAKADTKSSEIVSVEESKDRIVK